MTNQTKGILFIVAALIFLLVFGGSRLVHFFYRSYLPPELTVTKNEIKSSGGFMDPVTIEKLKVDSIGKEQRPVKYILEYVTTCTIQQANGEQPVALKEIKLDEPGGYSWSEENVNILIDHPDGFSKRAASVPGVILSKGLQKFSICPLKFEKGNWYFINFQDPVFIGVFIYMDESGAIKQYGAYSGKLPV